MNPLKNLILLYDNKLKKEVDKCDEIKSIINKGHNFDIQFCNSEKIFTYNKNNVTWITKPVEIDLNNKYVFIKDTLTFSAKKVLKFDKWYKVFYDSGKHYSYYNTEIKIIRTVESEPYINDALSYLKRVTEILDDKDGNSNFLSTQIAKMRPIEGCFLDFFLKKKSIEENQIPNSFIFPFGSNYSQMQAVKKAFKYNVSVIQGPPGTGKTQTILNIVANIILNGKNVAVVSGNNEATKNVAEKLGAGKLSFLTAFLGKKENIESFFISPPNIPKQILGWANIKLIDKKYLNEENSKLEDALRSQISIPKLKKKIEELKIEKIFSDNEYKSYADLIHKSIRNKKLSSANILKTAALLELLAKKEKISIITKMAYLFKYNIKLSKGLLTTLSETIDYLHNKYYAIKLRELTNELVKKEEELKNINIEKLKRSNKNLSRELLYKVIADRYKSEQIDDNIININNYRSHFANFVKKYPIVFSTTNALQFCTGEGFLYDYVIIDESSQVDIVTACIAFACAKKVVLVGDKMQLPHVVKNSDIAPLKHLFSLYKLPKEIEYCSHSVLDAITKMYGKNLPNTLLNEHYRCDPRIIDFCNRRFYDNKLILQTTNLNDNHGIKIITTESHHANNRTNIRQIEILKTDILPELEKYIVEEDVSIGIMAPYRNQVELLQQNFLNSDYLIDTVHKFQGKERDIVIILTVSDRIIKFEDEERIDFLNNPNLINVAISRAKSILYVVASSELINQTDSLLNDLSKYNTYYCGVVPRQTKVYSVFDLMFEEYSNVLQPIKNRLMKISEYESENIIATLIDDICKSKQYGILKFYHNYELRKVININYIENIEDYEFVKNPNTHCDFIIFDTLNKEIRLVVEVDGRQHNTVIQKARDERKDRLLKNAGVKVLRLPTTAVECKEKIEKALENK